MSAALPVSVQTRPRRETIKSSRQKNGLASFVKPLRLAFCKSVFPEANHLPGAISPNWFARRVRQSFTRTSSPAASAWMTIACAALRDAGLDSVQLSFQSDKTDLADEIAGARAHQRKLDVAAKIRAAGIPLSLNFVIHRRNIDRLAEMIDLAESLRAERVELANVQFYGWAFLNRAALLPTREQVVRAREIATAAKARLAGKIDIFYVLPDYYETRPKPCLNGWGQRYLTVNPIGDVLPCPTASSAIPDLRFENVRARALDWIWRDSESFNRFRGTEWMPEPCQSCPQREIDFGGCRCQAALLTGNAANTDPVCEFCHQIAQAWTRCYAI